MSQYKVRVVLDATLTIEAPTPEDAIQDAKEIQDEELNVSFGIVPTVLNDISVRAVDYSDDAPWVYPES